METGEVYCEDRRLQSAWVAAGYRIANLGDRKDVHYERFWVWLRDSGNECDCGFLHGHRSENDTDGFLSCGLACNADLCPGTCLVDSSLDARSSWA